MEVASQKKINGHARAASGGVQFSDKRLDEANGLLWQGQVMEAVAVIKTVMAEDPKNHGAIFLLAQAAEKAGETKAALNFYSNAEQLAPKEIAYYLAHMELLHKVGLQDAAVLLLQTAIRHLPNEPLLYLKLGLMLDIRGDLKNAIAAFQEALKLAPDNADAHAGLAVTLEMTNDVESSEKHARAALALNAGHVAARVALAKVLRRAKKLEEARQENERVIKETSDPHVVGEAHLELGRTLEGLKRYDDAFPEFQKAQSVFAEQQQKKNQGKPNIFNLLVEACQGWFTEQKVGEWVPYQPRPEEHRPVFLVGFPRSGTTLVEQILSAHPEVEATQEKDFIASLISEISRITGRSADYPAVLTDLKPEHITLLRQRYWEKVKTTFNYDPEKLWVVDKMPVNIAHLGLIHRVFPKAAIIVCIRDPRDVILSCFVQSFTDNPAMSNFQTVEGTVSAYIRVMNLYQQYKQAMPKMKLLEIKYEELVVNMEAISRQMLAHAEIPWNDEVLKYYEKDKNRYVLTPSYEGVMKPAYTSSVGKWRRYEKQLLPHYGALKELLERFNYKD